MAVAFPMSQSISHSQSSILGWRPRVPHECWNSVPLHSDCRGNQRLSLSSLRLILQISSSSRCWWVAGCWHYWMQAHWLMVALTFFFFFNIYFVFSIPLGFWSISLLRPSFCLIEEVKLHKSFLRWHLGDLFHRPCWVVNVSERQKCHPFYMVENKIFRYKFRFVVVLTFFFFS